MSASISFLRDPAIETAAKRFANELTEKYKAERKAYPHLDSICIDYMDGYPTDAVLERASAILSNLWRLEPRQFEATSGRAGCIWVTPKFKFS